MNHPKCKTLQQRGCRLSNPRLRFRRAEREELRAINHELTPPRLSPGSVWRPLLRTPSPPPPTPLQSEQSGPRGGRSLSAERRAPAAPPGQDRGRFGVQVHAEKVSVATQTQTSPEAHLLVSEGDPSVATSGIQNPATVSFLTKSEGRV